MQEIEDNNFMTFKTPEREFFNAESGLDFHWWQKNKTPYHTHTYYEIVLIASGNVVQVCNDKKYDMEKYDLFLLKPGDWHAFLHDSTANHLNFSVTTDKFSEICAIVDENIFKQINDSAPIKIACTPMQFEYIASLARQVNLRHNAYAEKNNTIIIRCIIINIVLTLLNYFNTTQNDNDPIPDWLRAFLSQLNSPEMLNKPLSEIYLYAPYSQTSFNKYFHKYMGTTLVQYFKNLKMTFATQQLLHSNLSISSIAETINYTTGHFIHEFTATYGMSPTKYRDKLNKK